jgi:PAS domain S-box-containing protein
MIAPYRETPPLIRISALDTRFDTLPPIHRVAVPALLVGADDRIIAANTALAQVLAAAVAAFRGSLLADWLVDRAPLEAFLSGAPGTSGAFAFRGGDGNERQLVLTLAHLDVGGLKLLTAFDLTPRIAAERRLREEMARYQDMTGAASDFFFELDATMTRLRLLRRGRDGGLELLEQQRQWPDEVIDLTYDLDAFANVIRKMLARKPVRDYIHRQRDADGSERFLRSSGVPYYDAQGVFQGYRGVSVDVTAQVTAERALRDSEARLRRSQQHLDQAQRLAATGSVERDLVSGAEDWSDEMYRLLGLERGAAVPSDATIAALLDAPDRDRVQEATRLARSGVAPLSGEFRIRRADGQVRTLYCETELAHDEKGKPVRSMTVFHDVTELRAAEARQKEMERQLLHAQKLESLGTLAGGIAHDLNNTLVPVLALTKLTAERLAPESRERKNLAVVLQASERARELVRQILAFSRKEEAERRPLDLAAVVREALAMLRASLPATVAIVERIAEAPSVFGDGGKLHQVIINLVTNAAHAIGEAMGSITVELVALERERAVRLTVIDTGCGMDETVMGRIFEPFFTTKAVGKGTGLGLSVVHGIISSHGGRMEVKSRVGEGTSFAVYLPLAAAPPDAAEAADGEASAAD